MTKFVSYVPDEVIEENAQLLLADYARARGVAIEPPNPIDDIIEKYLKIGIEFDDTHRLFDMPRSGIGSEPDILGAIFFDQRRIVIDESLDPDARIELQPDLYASCVLMPRKLVFCAWDEAFPDRKQRVLQPATPIDHPFVEIARFECLIPAPSSRRAPLMASPSPSPKSSSSRRSPCAFGSKSLARKAATHGRLVLHVHDEIVAEVPVWTGSKDDFLAIITALRSCMEATVT